MTDRELERFMDKVRERDGCWIWTAATFRGVGAFRREGARRTESAPRAAYAHFIGQIPFGSEMSTSCGVRACVNPEHLVALRRGTASSTTNTVRFGLQKICKNGHSLENAYVTPDGRRDCRECGRERKREYKKTHLTKKAWSLSRKGEMLCRNCGSADNLHLHHAIPRSKCGAVKAELLNGLPLCAKCHMGWHHHKTTIYRDVFTREEWDFLVSVNLTGELIEPWLDKRYPDRGVSFRGEYGTSDPW